MDNQIFIEQTFDFGTVDVAAQDRAIKAAERGVGKLLSLVVEGSREQDFMSNIAQRHYLTFLTKSYLTEHNYGSAALNQKFLNHLALLKLLNEEWIDLKVEMRMTIKPESFFEIIPPGFQSDPFGRSL